jgi:hypothetical protein
MSHFPDIFFPLLEPGFGGKNGSINEELSKHEIIRK